MRELFEQEQMITIYSEEASPEDIFIRAIPAETGMVGLAGVGARAGR